MSIVRELPANFVLRAGGHKSIDDGACAMELASYLAGEEWFDHPKCVCPVISTFMRSWNDEISDCEERTKLLGPLVPKLIGTRGDATAELARAMLCVDWLIREWLPAWMLLTPALAEHAGKLRSLSPIQSWEDFDRALPLVNVAHDLSAAARAAARAAAWAAAMDAAMDAAWAAAMDAAMDAAWDAAWDAARAAARKKLTPTKERLQLSAVALVERMIAVGGTKGGWIRREGGVHFSCK